MQLMTVHAAKGLEFDAVFVCGLEEGLFPHENSSMDNASLEEERRLLYVAITRARKRLYISFAQTRMLHGYTRYASRSRFLNELPDHTTKWLSPKSDAHQPQRGYGSNNSNSISTPAYGGSYKKNYSSGYAEQTGGSDRYERRSNWGNDNDGESRFKGKDAADFGSAHIPFKPKAVNSHGLSVGIQVFHNKFGEGTVLALQGDGEAATAKIKFGRHGEKWLALGVAKLQII